MPIFYQAPDRVIQRLDSVGRKNHFSNLWRIGKKRCESIQLLVPGPTDGRVFIIPRLGKVRQPRCDLLGSGRLVHALQISSDLFALFPRDIIEAVTHYLDDAQLHLSLGKNRFDRLWKTA